MESERRNLNNKKLSSKQSITLFIVAIILFATTLRTPLTIVGPIISFIRDGLGISNVLAGFLTTIPLLAFAIISPFAARIARKFGMEWTLFYSVVLVCVGILLRSVGATYTLVLGTVLIGIAIAFGNVLIPSYFKLKFPLHIGLLTGIYTVSMNITAGLAAGFSQNIASRINWQIALGFPLLLGVCTLLIWIMLLRDQKVVMSLASTHVPKKQLSKVPLAWAIAMVMGLQSFIFYCSTAWLPDIFINQGLTAETAGWMGSIMQLSQIPMTFLIPIIAAKLHNQRPIVIFFTVCYLLSFIGVWMEWTNLAVLWMIFLGFAGGASFGFVLMLFTLRTKTAYEAAELSGFAQSIGYLVAAVGPVLFGYLHDYASSWNLPLLLFIIISVLLFFASFISAKNRYV